MMTQQDRSSRREHYQPPDRGGTIDPQGSLIGAITLAAAAIGCVVGFVMLAFDEEAVAAPFETLMGLPVLTLICLALSMRLWRRHRQDVAHARYVQRQCPSCSYSMTGLPQPRCPECGATWNEPGPPELPKP